MTSFESDERIIIPSLTGVKWERASLRRAHNCFTPIQGAGIQGIADHLRTYGFCSILHLGSVLNYSSQLSELLSQSSYSSLILVKSTSLANKLVSPSHPTKNRISAFALKILLI
jgi:hypothetical protein